MEPHYQACKERRVPLGEYLVGCGVLKGDDLRGVLLQHTAESLGHLCATDARLGWCPRVGPGYSPQFTFATTELLEQIGASRHQALAARVKPVLNLCFRDEDWAAAFVRTATSAFPEPIATVGRVPASATALLRSGKWAASGLVITGETSTCGPARILNRRAEQRRRSERHDADL